jgi:hypothetical protein
MEIESGNKWQTSGNKFECEFCNRLYASYSLFARRRRVEDNRVSYGVWHYIIPITSRKFGCQIVRGFFKVYNLPPYEQQQQAAGRKKRYWLTSF